MLNLNKLEGQVAAGIISPKSHQNEIQVQAAALSAELSVGGRQLTSKSVTAQQQQQFMLSENPNYLMHGATLIAEQ